MVYQLLQTNDVCYLYEQVQDEREGEDPRAHVQPSSYAQFDDATFLELYSKERGPDLREIDLYLEGIHCAACVWLVEKLPSMVEGVTEARLQFRKAQLHLVWKPSETSLSTLAQLLERLGYPPHPYRDLHRHSQQRAEDRKMLIRIAVAGAAAGNVMLMAFALYSGLFQGMENKYQQLFRWASFVVALPSVLWASQPFFRGAWASLKMRSLHMDLPISIGIAAGFGWGTWNTLTHTGEIYFDSVTTLIFFLLVGRWLQLRQQRQAAEATELMHSLAPSTVRRIEAGGVREIPVEALNKGDLIEVRAGDTISVDGTIREGSSRLDLSFLTGESKPIVVDRGESVHAGSLNIEALLCVEVETTGSETRLGQLLKEVESASERRAPIVQLADRIAGMFVAIVLVLALITLLVWLWIDPNQALGHAVALLIVTCPCALGLATPLAISAALGKAAKQGILIKGGEILEALSNPGRLWLDKTGTLTKGQMSLVGWKGDTSIQSAVRAMEAQSVHPIAKALVEALPDEQKEATIQQIIGRGLIGSVDGLSIHIGAPEFIRECASTIPDWFEPAIQETTHQALTPVAIAVNSEVRALAQLGDPLREDAVETLEQLKQKGWKIGILSGDHPDVVRAVARQLPLDLEQCHGGLSPEEKQAYLEQRDEVAVMVGDGVNDAAALAIATVGVSVHGGAEASLAIADVYLAEEGLTGLHQLIEGARRTSRVIRMNFIFSIAYNMLGALLAMTGWITPLWAAVLMPLSSLTVISNSYRARTFLDVQTSKNTEQHDPTLQSTPQSALPTT